VCEKLFSYKPATMIEKCLDCPRLIASQVGDLLIGESFEIRKNHGRAEHRGKAGNSFKAMAILLPFVGWQGILTRICCGKGGEEPIILDTAFTGIIVKEKQAAVTLFFI
jgi:hypothetical protein